MRESHRLGFGSHCERHAELLNRIVSVGTDSDGRRYVRIEPDIRHAELVLRGLGLEGSKAKPLTTPGFKVDEKELALREKEVPLDSGDATRYRSCVGADLVEVFSQVDGKANARKSRGSQEGCTLLVGGPNTWLFYLWTNVSEVHFNSR